MALTPTEVAQSDFKIIQKPLLGGEVQMLVTTSPHGIRKTVKNIGGDQYRTRNLAGDIPGAVNLVGVEHTGLSGELAGLIEVPVWAEDQSTRFPCGWGGEGVIPGAFGVRGEQLVQVQVPDYDGAADPQLWYEIGALNDKKLTLPMRMSKAIPNGLVSAYWVKPGKTSIGEMTVSAQDRGPNEGLRKIAGLPCCVMLEGWFEDTILAWRTFVLDWTPEIDVDAPASDGDAIVTCKGLFSRAITLFAPGAES